MWLGRNSDSPTAGALAQRIQREIVLLLAWGPAILLQLAHPLVARGVADHSVFPTQRWGRWRRLYRTVGAMRRLAFGTIEEGQAVIARINAIHDQVHGRLAEAEGPFPSGTPYSAHDPALLAWVHATLLIMNLRVYELYVADLSREEKDRYCDEASAIGPYLGIPDGRLPRSFSELRVYVDAMLASGEIAVTDTARRLAQAIVYPSLPRVARPAMWLVRLPTLGLLPPTVRAGYGLAWPEASQAMLQLSAGCVRNFVLPLTPSFVRHWPATQRARRAATKGGDRRQGRPLA